MKTKKLLGDKANEDNLKGRDLKRYGIVHFAVHSRIEHKKPFHSSLILTRTKKNDGYLNCGEIFNLDFKANLIVLSACQTALGKLIRGEGIEGLTRAIMYAGTPSIITTLRKIPDKPTYIFMKKFYKNLLSGKSKLESLKATKLSFLKSKDYNAPYFWAAFVLYGKRD